MLPPGPMVVVLAPGACVFQVRILEERNPMYSDYFHPHE